jgi:hypothetical protein
VLEGDPEKDIWRVRADVGSHATRLVHLAESPNGDTLGVDFDASRVLLLSDTTSLYSGYAVRVDRINAVKFPEVFVDVSVEDRLGRPIVGMAASNFVFTESHRSVGEVTLAQANTDVHTADVTLLVEGSPAMSAFRPEVQRAAADLFALITQGGRIKAVSAGERPVREADFGETRLRFISAAQHGEASARWKLDAAVRLAGEELLADPRGAKRAVVFLTSGGTGQKPFSTYSLTELAAFLRNNAIAFYPVFFGPAGLDEELSFLATETGGKGYPVLTPGGMADVVADIRSRVSPVYTLRYASPSEPEFGTRYIPLEVEAMMQTISGRDESGYYSPPSAAGRIEPLKIPTPSRTE